MDVSFELSVSCNNPPDPDRAKLNDPWNILSLYLALSTDITQKSSGVKIF